MSRRTVACVIGCMVLAVFFSAAYMAFLIGHLITAVVVLAAAPHGTQMAGLPRGTPVAKFQKTAIDWDTDRWARDFRGCNGIISNIRQPFANNLVRLVAADLGLPWASLHSIDLGYALMPSFQPPGWKSADCIASDNWSELHSGRRIIWLVRDIRAFEFTQAQSGTLDIGLSDHPGVTINGAYAIEKMPFGTLRWTSGNTEFRIANAPNAPVSKLVLTTWPMPISSNTRLQLAVNGVRILEGPVPLVPVAFSLDRFANQSTLIIELRTTPTTRFSNDPRELGIALRELSLEK